MIEIDTRVAILAALAGLATLAAPVAIGGWLIAAGVVAAILTTRSVLRSEEGDVTTAIIVGGLLVLLTLGHGQLAAFAVCAGVFAGSEIAALARRLGVDRDAPASPEVRGTAVTIGVGLAAGAVLAVVATIRASAPVANIALVAIIVLGLALLVTRAWKAVGAGQQR